MRVVFGWKFWFALLMGFGFSGGLGLVLPGF